MRQILVAVFETVANADSAVQALKDANVSSASIRRYHRDDPAMENLSAGHSTHTGSASTAPAGRTIESINALAASGRGWRARKVAQPIRPMRPITRYYGRHVETGSTVLAVTVEHARASG